jgi:hypothetical protein
MRLYLNGYRMDTDNVSLSLTFNFNNTLSGQENAISHSNQIKLPITKRNSSFFNEFKNNSYVPSVYECYVVNEKTGITTFFGFAYRVNKEPGVFSVELYQNLIDFFDSIDQLNLPDLQFSTSYTWNQTLAAASRNTTSGLVAPLIDYGQLDPTSTIPQLFRAPISPFDVLNYPPSVYFKDVYYKIFDDMGYSVDTIDDVLFDKLILPYGRNDWPGSTFTIADILPDISQKDFLAQFQSMFGAKFMLTDASRTFRVKLINDALRTAKYYDWSSKFQYIKSDKTQDLAQSNIFKWKESTFNQGSFAIVNPYLPRTKTIFESAFYNDGHETYQLENGGATIYGWQNKLWDSIDSTILTPTFSLVTVNNVGGKAEAGATGDVRAFFAQGDKIFLGGGSYGRNGVVLSVGLSGGNTVIVTSITYINSSGTVINNLSKSTSPFDNAPNPNLAVVREPIAGVESFEIFFGNLNYSDYLVAYRYADYDGNQPPLTWAKHAGLLTGSYPRNRGYIEERYYNLNDLDIIQMQNEERMIFDKGEVYLVNAIVDYVPNQVTKVQMIRVL